MVKSENATSSRPVSGTNSTPRIDSSYFQLLFSACDARLVQINGLHVICQPRLGAVPLSKMVHQCGTQCHLNTIGRRTMPRPIIRILLPGGRTTKVEHSAIRILLAGAQCRHQSSEYYLRAGGPRKPNTVPSEYYWRACNAETNHQNTISGREDHQRGTQCHQNTISGREDHPSGTQCHQNTISGREDHDRLLAGGRTTKVERSAIRILLAGGPWATPFGTYKVIN